MICIKSEYYISRYGQCIKIFLSHNLTLYLIIIKIILKNVMFFFFIKLQWTYVHVS